LLQRTTLHELHVRSENSVASFSARTPSLAFGVLASTAAIGALALFNRTNSKRAERRNTIGGNFVEIQGVKLHYLSRGKGPSLALLHGNGSMIQDWLISGLIDKLATTHRVIAFDRPGFGFSDRPRSSLWTPEAQAELLTGAFDQLGIERPVVVGHSFGTQVAIAMAIDQPEKVSRLVLIGGYYYPTARADVVLSSGPAIPVIGDLMRYTVSPPIGRLMEPGVNSKLFAPAEVTVEWKEQYPTDMALRPSQIRAVAAEAALMVPSAARLSRRYSELALPVTVIAGDGDRLIDPIRQSARLHEALPRSKLVMIPKAGHMVHHTASSEVQQAIEGRLQTPAPIAAT
jgi:pimeloyl-ACP methyl ester carboxylesterase